MIEEPRRAQAHTYALSGDEAADFRASIDGFIRRHGRDPRLFESFEIIADRIWDIHFLNGDTIRIDGRVLEHE